MKKCALLVLLPCIALAIYSMDSLTVNHWRVMIYNEGTWGADLSQLNFPGGSWPAPLRNSYIFGAGIWIGSITPSETLVTVGYDPNSGATEFGPALCRYWRGGYADSADRIYKHPGDWPPPLGRFPMAPQNWRSDQDLWCCFGDSDPGLHVAPETSGLGVDVALTVYGFADSAASDFFFLKYDVLNNNDYPFDSLLIAMAMDADIGDATDDLVGFIHDKLFQVQGETIRVRNTGFCYDNNNIERHSDRWDSGAPGMVAVSLLSSPDDVGLSAFKLFSIDVDPVTDPTRYQTMAGYNYRTGYYEPFDTTGDQAPGDKRFLEASGPVDVPAHGTATFWYAIIGSPFGDPGEVGPKHDTSELAIRYRAAQERFRQLLGVQEPGPVVPTTTTLCSSIFSPSAPLCIRLGEGPTHTVTAFDLTGRPVRKLTGRGVITWDGTGKNGQMLPAGVYFLQVTGPDSRTGKVVLER